MKNKKNSGFTLIEVIIVIAIIGIVLAIAAPSFSRYRDNANLKEAARELSSDIQLYKQKAMSENVPYRITFSGTKNYIIANQPSSLWVTVKTKSVGGNNSAIVIYSSNYSSGIVIQTRGTMPAGTVVLKHSSRLSTATITTSIIGRVQVSYDLK